MEGVTKVFEILLPYLAVGSGLTILTQLMKRIARLEKTTVILLLFHTLTFLATLATWWVNHAMALYSLVLHGTAYSGAASALYPLVRWADGKITKFSDAVKLVKKYEPALEQIVHTAEETTGISVEEKTSVSKVAESSPAPADF